MAHGGKDAAKEALSVFRVHQLNKRPAKQLLREAAKANATRLLLMMFMVQQIDHEQTAKGKEGGGHEN